MGELANKDFKVDCGFRKHLRACNFKIEQCRPPKDGDDYGDVCHLYPIDWTVKSLKAHGKCMSKDMLDLERSLKKLKKEDKDEYKQTKKIIKDMFYGLAMIGKGIAFIKRSGGLKPKEKKVADKLMEKLKKDAKKA